MYHEEFSMDGTYQAELEKKKLHRILSGQHHYFHTKEINMRWLKTHRHSAGAADPITLVYWLGLLHNTNHQAAHQALRKKPYSPLCQRDGRWSRLSMYNSHSRSWTPQGISGE